ncbi:hypothetical protein [Streptomyces europaeiscabiei]|uniref:hypothetical protein n=1 Tax=Streptomyces europaeiscabiei TaxID=146819 RepID=UPI0029AFD64F|nr:hypothetical protein [Streptomyces europaeiscabiei]MDX2758513.1 hypothetical protein [Streptomyces europaeiscabiei]MDX2767283.1 hypothetical protein [Streptomyces europaeiscabiei]
MDQVDDDVDVHAALQRFGLDEVDLLAGPVDQDDPATAVAGVAVLCLVEHGGHHLRGGVGHRAAPPLRQRAERATTAPAADYQE